MLRRLLETHGEETIRKTGLETLGYPPEWVHTTTEAIEIQKALTTENKGNQT